MANSFLVLEAKAGRGDYAAPRKHSLSYRPRSKPVSLDHTDGATGPRTNPRRLGTPPQERPRPSQERGQGNESYGAFRSLAAPLYLFVAGECGFDEGILGYLGKMGELLGGVIGRIWG